eukprot:scaffold2801_cov266-Pinguiococcus_pyrenoidosus.AAC.9
MRMYLIVEVTGADDPLVVFLDGTSELAPGWCRVTQLEELTAHLRTSCERRNLPHGHVAADDPDALILRLRYRHAGPNNVRVLSVTPYFFQDVRLWMEGEHVLYRPEWRSEAIIKESILSSPYRRHIPVHLREEHAVASLQHWFINRMIRVQRFQGQDKFLWCSSFFFSDNKISRHAVFVEYAIKRATHFRDCMKSYNGDQ